MVRRSTGVRATFSDTRLLYWHKTDSVAASRDVRSSGQSRSGVEAPPLPSLTHNGRGHRQKIEARNGLMTCVVDLRRGFPLQNPLADNRPGVLYFVRAGSASLPRRRFSGSSTDRKSVV